MTEAEEIRELIKEAVGEPLCRDLLHFMVVHPYTRFNRPALIHLFGLTKTSPMAEALDKLMSLRLIEGQIQSGLAVFWLTREEPTRSHALAWFEKGGRLATHAWATQITMPLPSSLVPA